ncbi:MAG: alpha/beta hydrolase [Planctomycetota bacterium]|nr:alpha/beta hydrolase [Planctomycetota bacterium]
MKWRQTKWLCGYALYLALAGVPLAGLACAQSPSAPHQRSPQTPQSSSNPKGQIARELEVDNERHPQYEFKKHGAIEYTRGEDYRLTLDVYEPEGEGPFPAVLAIHGGAWRSGSKITMLRHAWKLASAGYVVVAINYRHAPEHKFPAQIHDCKQAVRWMRKHASQYSIDPDRIAAFGYSAGGHLAALLGTTSAEGQLEGPGETTGNGQLSARVQAVIAGGAVCDFSWIDPESTLLKYWIGATRETDPAAYLAASPIHYISKEAPPFFFYHGKKDAIVPFSSAERMHRKLTEQGTPSKFIPVAGKGHLATFADIQQIEACIDFLRQHMPARGTKAEGNSHRQAASLEPTAREDN